MGKSFFNCFLTVFTVIGSVIGAGFITGKEIHEFFANDFSVSGVYLAFICFWVFIYLMMSIDYGKYKKHVEVVVALASIIISGCMISALDEVYVRIFRLSEKVKILSVITAILVFITSLKGVRVIEKCCFVLIPIVIAVLISFTLSKTEYLSLNFTPKSKRGIYLPFIYVGFNLLLSSKIIKKSGEILSPPFKILSSFIISLILCFCIFIVGNLLYSSDKLADMPFREMFLKDVKLLIIIDIITLFAIITTLFSSVYTSIEFGGVNLKLWQKILILLLSLAVSNAGFSAIVQILYPILGVIGYGVISFTYLLRLPFLKERRVRTYRLLKRTK